MILDLVQQFADLRTIGLEPRMSIFVVPDEITVRRMYIERKSVAPTARNPRRIDVHHQSSDELTSLCDPGRSNLVQSPGVGAEFRSEIRVRDCDQLVDALTN